LDLIDEISRLDNINIQGLMTVGLLTDNQAKIAECFHLTKSLFDQANKNFSGRSRVEMKYLSMGMTHDYQIALQCGSNMVRIGSGIFV